MNLNIGDPDQSEGSLERVAHFWCSAVTVCPCGFPHCLGLEQKIDSNITLLPLPLPLYGTRLSTTNTHTRKPCRSHCANAQKSTFGFQHSPVFVCLTQFFVPLKSSPHLVLSFPVSTSCSFFPLTRPPPFFQSHVAAGAGEPGADEYHSLVLYHNNSPRWGEQIKLPIPVDMFRGSHVRFEFRHCSSK